MVVIGNPKLLHNKATLLKGEIENGYYNNQLSLS
jgi:hypothetical protein